MEHLDNPAVPAVEPTVTPGLTSRQSFFRETPWRLSDLIIGFAPLLVAKAAFGLIDRASLSAAPSWSWMPLTVLAMVWMLVFPLWIARRRLASFPRLPRLRAVFVEAPRALLVMLALIATLVVVFQPLAYFFGDSAMPDSSPLEPIAHSPNWFERLGFLILVFAIAPVAEEVFFRGMLYNFLRKRLHLVVAILIQAVVFALMHPFDLAYRAMISIIAVGFGLIYEWRKTLLSPILLHALLNAFFMTVSAWNTGADADAPRLGVVCEPRDRGCLITMVAPGSAAQAAGLKVGDLITAVDEEPVADMPRLIRIIRGKKVGDQVTIKFTRDGEAKRVEAVLTTLRE
jgi:uncharacterized protein